jgi:hypothetical protein
MSKNAWRWLLLLAVIIVAIWFWRSRRPPDERLAAHFEAICDIAEHDADHPSRGVDHLFAYLGANSPEMMRDLGDTLVLIERIDDDAAHDARAQTAAERLQMPLIACAAELQRFGEAIENDPEAAAKFQRGAERFVRTLQILLGGPGGARLTPRALLDQLTGMSARLSPPGYQ